jgi:hypothetical protein
MDDYDFVKSIFAGRVSDPLAWFSHSRSLTASARLLKERANLIVDLMEKSRLEMVCSMLYGLAIENLFKAMLMYRKRGSPHLDNWTPIDEFPSELKTHNLIDLAKMVDETIATKYEASLYLLTEAAIWSGRYPCSIKGEEGGTIIDPSVHEDAEQIYKLFSKYFTMSS